MSGAVADFNEAVREEMQRGTSRRDAVRAVVKRNPKLHRAYLEATNPPRVHGRIAARFGHE